MLLTCLIETRTSHLIFHSLLDLDTPLFAGVNKDLFLHYCLSLSPTSFAVSGTLHIEFPSPLRLMCSFRAVEEGEKYCHGWTRMRKGLYQAHDGEHGFPSAFFSPGMGEAKVSLVAFTAHKTATELGRSHLLLGPFAPLFTREQPQSQRPLGPESQRESPESESPESQLSLTC